MIDIRTFKAKFFYILIGFGALILILTATTYILAYRIIKAQEEVIAVYQHSQEVPQASAWQTELLQKQTINVCIVLVLMLAAMALTFWAIRLVWLDLKRRIAHTHALVDDLSKGNLAATQTIVEDEFKDVYASINTLNDNLMRVKAFAEEVGKGHFDTEVTVFNNAGVLGVSLAQMRHSLKEVAANDLVRTWTSEGIAKFAQLMRQHSDDMDQLCYVIVRDLIKYLNANQGAIFIANHVAAETVLDMKACYAYERRKYVQKTLLPGEGLAGQVFVEGQTMFITEVPKNYFNITSGLGDAFPRSILIVPLKLNERIVGVLELASLYVFRPQDIAFVEKIAESIASTVTGAQVAADTQHLLRDSLMSGEQLRAQEEELRQNLEEIQATQEQLQRQAEVMRGIQDKLMLEKSMFSVLMEYLPDRLTYKDKESKVIRVNSAKAKRFNLEPEQMVGTSDFDFFPQEHAQKARNEEVELMRIGNPMLNIQEKVNFEDGKVMFINTSRIPFKNEEGDLIGVFIISKDITQQKLQEATIHSQDKLLREIISHSTAFSYKVDRKGHITSLYMGNLSLQDPDLVQLENTSIQELLPDFEEKAKQSTKGEFFKISSSATIAGQEVTLDHHLFEDEVYDQVYWGIALLRN